MIENVSSGRQEVKLKTNVIDDLINLIVIIEQLKDPDEDDVALAINKYVWKRVKGLGLTNGPQEELRQSLTKYYNIVYEEMREKPPRINAYVPHRRAGTSQPDAAIISSGIKKTGGIDLNFQPQFIQQSSKTGPTRLQEAAVPGMPGGFKGFDFHIVRFTSGLTVNGAFRLMFNPD